ncbi:MAG: hypothetical protein IPJ06_15055 [Saprospiraceae bacterium]|nr:hypothetical protein [Saprospiraceae bacterium]
MHPTLSKSDFILATDCPKKLVYKKAHYPTSNDTDAYMEMLAQGGYIIGHMATLYYPDGIHVEGNTAEAVSSTQELMTRGQVILFEPAFIAGQKVVRVDILVKDGNHLQIIEVKSKSFDSH